MLKPRIVKDAAKGFAPDRAFADVFVAVELGPERGLGVVHVPDLDVVEADQTGDLRDRRLVAFGGD